MIEGLREKVKNRFDSLLVSGQIIRPQIEELNQRLAYLAFNLADSSSNSSGLPGEDKPTTPLVDLVEKDLAAAWMYHIRPRNAYGRGEPVATSEEKQKASQLWQLAQLAGLLIQSERAVFFSDLEIQTYFCAVGCCSQPFDITLLARTTKIESFHAVWPLWAELDTTLITRLVSRLSTRFDTEIRKNVVRALGYIGNAQALEPLWPILQNRAENLAVLSEAIKSLAKFKGSQLTQPLLNSPNEKQKSGSLYLAADRNPAETDPGRLIHLLTALKGSSSLQVRSLAMWGLGHTRSEQAIDPLLEALHDPSSMVRTAAVRGLGKLDKNNRVVETLVACLQDEDDEMVFDAMEALRELRASEAAAAIAALLKTNRQKVREAVTMVLYHLPGPGIVPSFIEVLTDPDEIFIEHVIDVLGRTKDPLAVEPLLARLSNENESYKIRLGCAIALGEIGDPSAIEPLSQILASEVKKEFANKHDAFNHQNLCGNLMNALGYIGGERAYEKLSDFASHTELNYYFVSAISKAGDIRAFGYLVGVLRSNKASSSAKVFAAQGLGKLVDKRAVEPLVEALKDRDASVRYYAAQALGRLGDDRALAALEWVKWNDTGVIGEWKVRNAAAKAIEILNG